MFASLDLAAEPQLRLTELIAALTHNAVDFVVIGGVAAQLHQLPMPATIDLDITPSRSFENLARLAKVFDEIDAALATAGEYGTWFPRHPISNWAQYDTIHLVTKFGLLDLVFAPEGTDDGFNKLISESQEFQLGEQVVRVISVETWERLKFATNRDKDIFHLLLLAQHRDAGE
ncbi:MAG: hypothetical protein ACKO8F_04795 [Acidimicrobiaceae bacterium]